MFTPPLFMHGDTPYIQRRMMKFALCMGAHSFKFRINCITGSKNMRVKCRLPSILRCRETTSEKQFIRNSSSIVNNAYYSRSEADKDLSGRAV